MVTISPGEGEEAVDLSGESFLAESVSIATTMAVLTVIVGLAGIYGGIEAYRGDSYRRSWWLGFLGLWSRGMTSLGPTYIGGNGFSDTLQGSIFQRKLLTCGLTFFI